MEKSSKISLTAFAVVAGLAAGSFLKKEDNPCDGFYPDNEVGLSEEERLDLLDTRSSCLGQEAIRVAKKVRSILADNKITDQEAEEFKTTLAQFNFNPAFKQAYQTVPLDKFPLKARQDLKLYNRLFLAAVSRFLEEVGTESPSRQLMCKPRREGQGI